MLRSRIAIVALAVLVVALVTVLPGCGRSDKANPIASPTFPTGIFFDRTASEIVELVRGGNGALALRSLTPRPHVRRATLSVEIAGNRLIVTASHDGPPLEDEDYIDSNARVFTPDSFGGYSLGGVVLKREGLFKPQPGEEDDKREFEDALTRWRTGGKLDEPPFQQALIPVPDREIVNVFESIPDSPASVTPALEALMAKRADCHFYKVVALDTDLLRVDVDAVRKRLAVCEPEFASSGQPFYGSVPKFYRHWLEEMERDRAGRNLFTTFSGFSRPGGVKNQGPDLGEFAVLLRGLRADDSYFAPRHSLLFGPRSGVSSYREFQIYVKCLHVLGDFCLFRGDPDGALGYSLPAHRMGSILSGHSNLLITSMIGIALRSISGEGVRRAYMDGMQSADQIHKGWPALDAAYREDLAATRDVVPLELSEASSLHVFKQNRIEYETRNHAAHARMALTHSAVAARYKWLTLSRFPADPNDFGPLLPAGLDPDPFADFNAPLRIAPETTTTPYRLYSVGPDREDQMAITEYDPTNGTLSAGDIRVDVPRQRQYPFPAPGELAKTRDGLLAQFPNGLPRDPFADLSGSSYGITATEPAFLFSWGPDTDQRSGIERGAELRAVAGPLPPAVGVSTCQGGFVAYTRQPKLDTPYDPTNGAVSTGDLWFCTGWPGIGTPRTP